MDDDIFDEDAVDELVAQLQDSNKAMNEQKKRETVTDENLEEFIMKTSSALIEDSLEVLQNVKQYTANSPDARECTSIAELIKASASAIDTLNKIAIQKHKAKTQIEVKQLDIDTKKGIANQEQQTKLLLSREDIMDRLIEQSEIIDIPSEESD